jgi:hypothetical protein
MKIKKFKNSNKPEDISVQLSLATAAIARVIECRISTMFAVGWHREGSEWELERARSTFGFLPGTKKKRREIEENCDWKLIFSLLRFQEMKNVKGTTRDFARDVNRIW